MDDQVGVAADRAREVAVRGAGEPGVAEVARVVAGLLQRLEDEHRERVSPAPRLLHVLRNPLARLGGDACRIGGVEPFRGRRRRYVEVGELREQEVDRLRIGPLVNPVQRLAAAAGEQAGDRLVREDHQLLDERVRFRLALPRGPRDPALAVELELDLGTLDAQRAAGEPAPAKVGRVRGRQLELGRHLRGHVTPLRLPVGEPRVAADDRPVEARLATQGWKRRRQSRRRPAQIPGGKLDGDAEAVDLRPQRAGVVGELRRQHRRDQARHVRGEGALGRAAVERRPGGHETETRPRCAPRPGFRPPRGGSRSRRRSPSRCPGRS